MIETISYDRAAIKPGILHFGVGNFHRAHEEYYTNKLLGQDPKSKDWGILGAMLLPSDEKLYKALKSQDGRYTLTVCGRDGKDSALEIGSLCDVLWAEDSREEIINAVADKAIRIISMTITEGGYNIDKQTGEFILSNADIQHDIMNPQWPKTVFGVVAEGLRRRMKSGVGGITILSCDNLQHNGNTARKSFMNFFEVQDKELFEWAKDNVSFPNSMVDRITPATLPADIDRLNRKNGTEDKAPVYCEDFIQWVVEDNFIAGRPSWEKAGVEFTDDVTAYEQMKLSLLNASHTLLSYPSFLAGYRKVDEAMGDEQIVQFVKNFMDKDVSPYLEAPGNTDLNLYKKTLLERFANHSVSDQISRLCFDGISKFPVYVIPIAEKMLKDGKDMKRIAYLIAAYRHYLKYQKDDKGNSFEIAEPWLTDEDKIYILSDNVNDFLKISPFKGKGFEMSEDFIKSYNEYCEEIEKTGAYNTLRNP